jgi:hypothetical protein
MIDLGTIYKQNEPLKKYGFVIVQSTKGISYKSNINLPISGEARHQQ